MRLGVMASLIVMLTACGTDPTVLSKGTPKPASTAVPSTATTGAPVATFFAGETTFVPVSPIATSTPLPPATTSTPGPAGQTGIAGVVTIGPTCPVQRIDSPCPDRPYEATITVWSGGTKVAETRSAADGHYLIELPAGSYRVQGESPSTFPRGTEQAAVVEAGRITTVDLQYDSGIR